MGLYYVGLSVVSMIVAVLISSTYLNTRVLHSLNNFIVYDNKVPQHFNPVLSPENCTSYSILESLASSVWCFDRKDGSKLCHFQNLYFSSKCEGCTIFLLNEFSTISGLKSIGSLKSINLSSVQNHTGLSLKINIELSCSSLLEEQFQFVEKKAILMTRFKPDNIMHVLHDDIFPLFTTYDELCNGDIQSCLSLYQLVFLDNNDKGPYLEWYEHMSTVSPMFKNNMLSVCLRNSVVGVSHSSTWYQYGFKSVHGPIVNTQLNGLKLRKFIEFIKKQFVIQESNVRQANKVVFLNRKINRKILNDFEVEENVKQVYKKVKNISVKVMKTDLTDNFRELITSIQDSNLLIGMHGSAMILSIFLPQGSSILELFPFGIQPNYVSSIKALSSLPEVNYYYKAWVNRNENNTVTHPEYPRLLGGISHLPLADQETISKTKLVPPVECCHNPLYLFRMFQDTVVDNSVVPLLVDLVSKENTLSDEDYQRQSLAYVYRLWYFPAPVFNISCTCVQNKLCFTWSYPFIQLKGIQFSIATSLGFAAIVNGLEFKSTIECSVGGHTQETTIQREVSLWVKAIQQSKESEDTYSLCKFYSLQ